MKTFKQFISERDGTLYYMVDINPELQKMMLRLLKDHDYRADYEDKIIVVTPKPNERLNKFQNKMFAWVSRAFEEGDPEIIKFTKSSKIDDLLNSDLYIEVDALIK